MAETENATTEGDGPPSGKQPRKRLKKLCSQIRDQMEFYFSDANIHKDRFMKGAIKDREDGYISLSVFANFNKLRQLTTDIKLVAKALSTSKPLQVSEDGELVRRRTEYEEPQDVDERTVYVECLSQDTDHEWLKQTFSDYGQVVYVSLPRYRATGDVKGFAFIEFDNMEAVEQVCQTFPPVDPNSDETQRFPKFNKQLSRLQRQAGVVVGSPTDKGEEKRGRRRRNTSESSGGEAPTNKRKRSSSDTEGRAGEEGGREGEEGRREKSRKRPASESEEEDREKEKKKRLTEKEREIVKKETEKENEKTEKENEMTEKENEMTEKETETTERATETTKTGTTEKETGTTEKAMGKELEKGITGEKEKKEEKEEEKEEKEKEMKGMMVEKRKRVSEVSLEGEGREMKRVRISDQVEVKENVEETHKKRRKRKKKEPKEKSEVELPHIKVLPKLAWQRLRDEYLQLQKSSMTKLKKTLQKVKAGQLRGGQEADRGRSDLPLDSYVTTSGDKKGQGQSLTFTPAVIVKVKSEKSFTRKELKDTLSLVASVPYVDLQDGDLQGYVRCATPEDALRVVASKPGSFSVTLLAGDEETEYWRKIETDRENKRASKTRSQKRGSQKLIARAEKTVSKEAPRVHIMFDDE